MPCDVLQERRHGEDGAGREPTAHVVARDVVEHGVVRDLEDVVLKLFQTVNAHYLGMGLGVAEDEIAEAHVILQQAAQVKTHLLRVFIDKAEALGLSTLTVMGLRALDDERHILVLGPYGTQQFETRLGIFHAPYGEAHVADHA